MKTIKVTKIHGNDGPCFWIPMIMTKCVISHFIVVMIQPQKSTFCWKKGRNGQLNERQCLMSLPIFRNPQLRPDF
jgi:hypothetical protein